MRGMQQRLGNLGTISAFACIIIIIITIIIIIITIIIIIIKNDKTRYKKFYVHL